MPFPDRRITFPTVRLFGVWGWRVGQLSKDQPRDDHAGHDQQAKHEVERQITAVRDPVHNVSVHAAVRGPRYMTDECASRFIPAS
jgi:hypothetical protein